MFTRSSRIRTVLLSFVVSCVCVGQALARPWDNLVPSQLSDMPRWPLYAAALVAIVIGTMKTIQYVRGTKPKTRVFPKLSLRRRLHAPYSGGNHAQIRFGSSDA